ncbi:MAG: twitching motility protein PilT [Candidatus Fischerbacteria bacterium RBG_13_37_8]|uniref:Twitching motility protein PilT n=1 Tax=Candidatus Fischerbacteria bacterium RBG_13_37_8 TaxID=1817863 RepID=A0A1F5VA08_9BACT|nr:MAG: twitching motility protein PilT [Candidatus Fischerbacteria bacterium RBG_13_37_8]
MLIWVLRIVIIIGFPLLGAMLVPLYNNPYYGMLAGLMCALLAIAIETGARKIASGRLVGLVASLVYALLLAGLVSLPIYNLAPEAHFIRIAIFVIAFYVGITLGYSKPEWFHPSNLVSLFIEKSERRGYKILDTSVIIDGRIADICETGFIEGTLIVPRFVLRELQFIADSSDTLKRNRGRRGIDILQRMQKKSEVPINIIEMDYADVKEVDIKLIELARELGAKIITNDYNLNKIAQLRGIIVLNINELASALRPVVLPGEIMKVFIIKEGKEANQGVAYLDDGTMVVIDNAKKYIGKNLDITVTSVLQTTMGKMIFGKYEGD